jgi:protoporphyrinogen IX oxidase
VVVTYEWVKVIHILAMTAWMAGLFYLPRLFVYHADTPRDSNTYQTFEVMERRLLAAIMRPAAVVTLLSGLALAHVVGAGFETVWLWIKLGGVLLMTVFHGFLEMHAARFRRGENRRSGRFFRVVNEIPTVLLIWIVIAVVVKPFS